MSKRFFSLLLTFVFCVSFLPPTVFAENESIAEVLQDEEVKTEEIAEQAQLAAEQEDAPMTLAANADDEPTGDGTVDNPYLIGTLNELKWFRDTVNDGKTDICAKLTADIALDSEWTPIGTAAIPYIGTFNGYGYRITAKEMTVDTQGWGLFGAIGDGGTVQALTVSINQLTVTVDATESGVMAAKNAGTIERCTVRINTKLYFKACIGLIAYQNSGTIENCWSGTVANNTYNDNINAAGIAYVNSGTIKSCYYNGTGRWRDYAVDYAITSSLDAGIVENCYCYDTNLWRGDNLYLDGKRNGITSVGDRERLATGEITWKLNGSDNTKTEPWRQDTQDANGCPTLDASAGRVTKNDDDTYTLETLHAHRVNGVLEDFTALADNLSGSGNYYLEADTVLGGIWTITGDAVLCLNGKTLTTAENANIVVQDGGTLTLLLHDKKTTDSAITGTGGSCITVSGGKLIMQDGAITNAGGTGVTLEGGSFDMQGGEISGCTTGVSVTGGTLTLSGSTKVINNPADDATDKQNILLAQNQKISFGELNAEARFGISVAGQDGLTDRVTVTDENGGKYFSQLVADGFKEDGTGFELYLSDDGTAVTLGKQNVHTHCVCGTEYTNQGHTVHSDVTFLPWTGTDSLPREGNYYLTRNVTLANFAYLMDANICLNGYTVTVSDGARIQAGANGYDNKKGSLTDCSGKGTITGRCIYIMSGSTINLYSGTLNGTWVEISSTGGGTFNMYGGKITNNKTTGAAVDGQNGKQITINMYGGEISGNQNTSEEESASGGGVYVGQGNQFNMYGGTITGNSAKNGGGVRIADAGNYGSGTFTMQGGKISGNTATGKGGGVYVGGAFNLSGDAEIQGNTVNNSKNNVYLPGGKTITIIGEPLQTIGVTTSATPADGKPVTIAKGGTDVTLDERYKDRFTPDADDTYRVNLNGNTLELSVQPHEHSVSDGENDVIWQPIDSEEALRGITEVTEGSCYYYLTDNITLNNTTWTPPDGMVLDLNGKNITMATDAVNTITVGENVNFTLTDCKGGGENYGSIMHYKPDNATKPRMSGCGVYVSAEGHFTMYDGRIGGNQNSGHGGGVYVAEGATFDMYGGEIGGNIASLSASNGGGIWTTGKTTIGGNAKIIGNSAQTAGGVYVNGGTLTLKDSAEVTSNRATNSRNGIFVGAGGKLCVSGSVCVTGNLNNNMGNNVYLQESGSSVTPISVVGALTADARIDVSVPDGVLKSINDDNFVPIAEADTKGWIQDSSFIGENDSAHKVIVSDGGKIAQLGTHSHKWVYTASSDGLSITAKCSNENCTADGGSVTIAPPDKSKLTYDGNGKAATLTGKLKTGVVPKITYEVKEIGQPFVALLPEGSVPKNAGYYKAAITVEDVTASVEYRIEKAKLEISDFKFIPPESLTYDGTTKFAKITSDKIDSKYITVTYWYPKDETGKGGGSAFDPKDVGTYVVKIWVSENTNYDAIQNAIGDEDNWKFTISPSDDYTVNVPESWTDSEKPIKVIEGSIFNTAIYAITQNEAVTVTATGVNGEKIVGRVDWYTDEACTQSVDRSKMIDGAAGTTVKLYWKFAFSDDSQKKNFGITEDKTGSVDVIIKEGEKQDLAFYDAGGVKTTGSIAKYGGYPIRIRVSNKTLNGGKVTCESSKPRVATIAVDTDGYATVTICGVGTTTITATADMVPGLYAKTTATYTLTVEKGVWGEWVQVGMPTASIYNEKPQTPELSGYNSGDYSVVTFLYSDTEAAVGSSKYKIWDIDNPPQLNAGTYYMYAIIGETANYNAFVTEIYPFEVLKAFAVKDRPTNLTAVYGQKLSDIELINPEGNAPGTWSWINGSESVGDASATAKIFKARFTPDDTDNYEIEDEVELKVTVNKAAAPAVTDGSLTVTNDVEETYSFDLASLLPQLNYGTITYGTPTFTGTDGYYNGGAKIENGKLSLLILANAVTQEGKIGEVKVSVTTDNYETVTLTVNVYAKNKSISHSGGGTTRYTVSFETNGGSRTASERVKRNGTLTEPTAPTKDGFDFAGWYADKELKEKYDFSAKVTKSMTLYAAWTEKDNSVNQIILTIGEKSAQVFGQIKTNDVAPKIVNDRTMLPARFVAENLGADVSWDDEKELVTIKGKNLKTSEDITILIYIGSDSAYVNGREVKLDSAAFVENDRTYTPIRFISEELGAGVEWIENEQKVVITK